MQCCDMKGYLTYLILWTLKKSDMNGAEISREFEKRRGTKPSPGTIYPALKELRKNGLITVDSTKTYTLTQTGESELKSACEFFCKIFYDADEMSEYCKK